MEPDRVDAYTALPPSGRGRAVLVVRERPGQDDFVRDVCDRLARHGFVALAPEAASSERDAFDAAVRELLGHSATEVPRVAALGLGAGGALALVAASRDRRIGAVVDLGGLPTDAQTECIREARLEIPVLAVLGGEGERAPQLEERLAEAGARVHVRVQPGVAADFLDERSSEHFDPRAAADCWDAVLAFLKAEP